MSKLSAAFTVVSFLLLFTLCSLHASWNHENVGYPTASSFVCDSSGTKMYFASNRSGLWISENGGETWIPANDRVFTDSTYTIRELQVLDSRADTVFLYDGNSDVHVTFDGGESWNMIEAPGSRFLVDYNNHDNWFSASWGGFFVSNDGGESWGENLYPHGFRGTPNCLKQDDLHDSTIWATSRYGSFHPGADTLDLEGISRSDNLGQNWYSYDLEDLLGIEVAEVADINRLSNGDLISALNSINPDELWENCVILSDDDGLTWFSSSQGIPQYFHAERVVEDTEIPGRLYLIGLSYIGGFGVLFSEDFGRTWQRMLNGLPENRFYVLDISQNIWNNNIYVSAAAYGIYCSENNGEFWYQIPSMPPVGSEGDLTILPGALSYANDYTRIPWLNEQPFEEWEPVNTPHFVDTLCTFTNVFNVASDTLCLVVNKRSFYDPSYAESFIARSYNRGQTWNLDEPLDAALGNSIDIYIGNDITRIMSVSSDYTDPQVAISEDNGENWIFSSVPEGYHIHDFTQNESSLFFSDNDMVFRSTDLGESWESLDFQVDNDYSVIFSLKGVGDELFLIYTYYCYNWRDGVWNRGEEQFLTQNEFYNCYKMMEVIPESDTLIIVGAYGTENLWVTSDRGDSWFELTFELPYPEQNKSIFGLYYDRFRQKLWASTGVGLCYLELDELDVGEQSLQFKPVSFNLVSVYPNPFNSSSRITYYLEQPSNVELELYNIEGRLVKSLFSGFEPGGYQDFILNSDGISSGTYFIKLQTSEKTITRKLVLLK